MSTGATPNLELPEFGSAGVPSGADISDGNRALDAIVQLAVIDDDLATPPASPEQGDRYLVATGATGEWAAHDLQIAYYTQFGWKFRSPRAGWFAWVKDEEILIWFDEDLPGWREFVGSAAANATLITVVDETSVLPNSRKMVAGTGMTFSTATPGQIVLQAAAGGGGSSAANVTPDTHPASPDAADDEFEAFTSIDTLGTRFSAATAWSWLNQGTLTSIVSQGALTIANTNQTTSIRGVTQAPSGATYRYRCKCSFFTPTNNVGAVGIALGKSGKLIVFQIGYNSGGFFFIQKYTNATTLSSSTFGTAGDIPATRLSGASSGLVTSFAYMEVEYNGTNVIFRGSGNGHDATFTTFLSETAATFLGGAPDTIGLVISGQAVATAFTGVWDWFRKVA